MKIKTEFVTNSSSTSFVVMGATIDLEDIDKTKLSLYADKFGVDPQTLTLDDHYLMRELFESIIDDSLLSQSFGDPNYDNEQPAVGINYTEMKDDQTLGQFKDFIKKEILNALGIDIEPRHIQMGWEDR